MAQRAQRGPDRLPADVERITEDHLPGRSSGADARSTAGAIVRHVRRIERAARTAAVTEGLDDVARRIAPRQAGSPGSEECASA